MRITDFLHSLETNAVALKAQKELAEQNAEAEALGFVRGGNITAREFLAANT